MSLTQTLSRQRATARATLRSVGFAAGLAALTYGVATLLSPEAHQMLHATLLAAIGAVYVGFAIADGRRRILVLEVTGALGFLAVAVAGGTLNLGILAAGYAAHGLWDLVHHRSHVPNQFAPWYIPLCVAYDWIVAGYLCAEWL